MGYLVTSESVSEGHPDKVADQISDAVLDALLESDPAARVACEVLVTTGLAFVSGEITTSAYVDIPGLVRGAIRSIGYTDPGYGIDGETCSVITSIDQQSPDIAQGVDPGGAGDQGMMYGYAVDERVQGIPDDVLMPTPILLAHRLAEQLARVRKEGRVPFLRPDGKAQVTLAYEDGLPTRVHTVVLSAQHDPNIGLEELRQTLLERVIRVALPEDLFDPEDSIIHINPTGRFVVGGPHGDTGLTGRKIIVDTYGGAARHGGGAFSGKDPSKVDRSAAYAARWAAKNVVGAGLARRCEIALAYAIGVPEPVSIHVESFGTGRIADERIAAAVAEVFDFRPRSLTERLGLRSPIYRPTATYGHFGRKPYTETLGSHELRFFPWEQLDRVDELRTAAGV